MHGTADEAAVEKKRNPCDREKGHQVTIMLGRLRGAQLVLSKRN